MKIFFQLICNGRNVHRHDHPGATPLPQMARASHSVVINVAEIRGHQEYLSGQKKLLLMKGHPN
jgi:hypothetical protein